MINNTNVNLGNLQENLEDGFTTMRQVGRKSALAYAGLLGMVYDITMKDGALWLDKAEKRGESLETAFITGLTTAQKQIAHEYNLLSDTLKQRVDEATNAANKAFTKLPSAKLYSAKLYSGKLYSEKLQAALQKFLRINPVAENSMGEAAQEIEVDIVKPLEVVNTASEAFALPFEGYDTMAWNRITSKLEMMDNDTLLKVRAFEFSTRKRPSILKAIQAKLEPETLLSSTA